MRNFVLILIVWILIGVIAIKPNWSEIMGKAIVKNAQYSDIPIKTVNQTGGVTTGSFEQHCDVVNSAMDDELRSRVCQSCIDNAVEHIADFAISHKSFVITRDGKKFNFNLTGEGIAQEKTNTIGGN